MNSMQAPKKGVLESEDHSNIRGVPIINFQKLASHDIFATIGLWLEFQ